MEFRSVPHVFFLGHKQKGLPRVHSCLGRLLSSENRVRSLGTLKASLIWPTSIPMAEEILARPDIGGTGKHALSLIGKGREYLLSNNPHSDGLQDTSVNALLISLAFWSVFFDGFCNCLLTLQCLRDLFLDSSLCLYPFPRYLILSHGFNVILPADVSQIHVSDRKFFP